jgi:hypothetical protein
VKLTLAQGSLAIDAGAGDEDIINNCENTFAADERTVFVLHFAIKKSSCFVQFNSPPVARFGERNFLRMKVVPARFPENFIWEIAKNVLYRIRNVTDSRV